MIQTQKTWLTETTRNPETMPAGRLRDPDTRPPKIVNSSIEETMHAGMLRDPDVTLFRDHISKLRETMPAGRLRDPDRNFCSITTLHLSAETLPAGCVKP